MKPEKRTANEPVTAGVDGDGQPLLRLTASAPRGPCGVGVQPRWPYEAVLVTAEALAGLVTAQAALDQQTGATIHLAVIRGYETPSQTMRRNGLRRLGATLFALLYPGRRAEIGGIFVANGHDRSGNHVDVRYTVAGRRMPVLLPLGPLTPHWLIRRTHRHHGAELRQVWDALRAAGFTIHSNASEALQIHADFLHAGATDSAPAITRAHTATRRSSAS